MCLSFSLQNNCARHKRINYTQSDFVNFWIQFDNSTVLSLYNILDILKKNDAEGLLTYVI